MAPKAVACLGGEGAETEGPVGDVAVDGVAAWRRKADAPRASAAGAESAYLEAAESAPLGLVDQHRFEPRRHRRRRLHRRRRPARSLAQKASKAKPTRLAHDSHNITTNARDCAERNSHLRRM